MIDETIELQTSDGARLRAALRLPDAATAGVVVCHPHPDAGGSMDVPVIRLLGGRIAEAGLGALRFNFRRPGSTDERLLDVRSALDHLETLVADVFAVGWSYGADLALATGATDGRVRAVAAIAPTLRSLPQSGLPERCLLLVPEHDQYTPPAVVRERAPDATIEIVQDVDHFLSGREEDVARRVVTYLQEGR